MAYQAHPSHSSYPKWLAVRWPTYKVGEHFVGTTTYDATLHDSEEEAKEAERRYLIENSQSMSYNACRLLILKNKLPTICDGHTEIWNGRKYDYKKWLIRELKFLEKVIAQSEL